MSEDLVPYEEHGLIEGSIDNIVQIAEQAEARVAAVIKIKRAALMVTNGGDWVDQNGKPYLMASGAEKVANLFNISWRFLSPEPTKTIDSDGLNVTYTYRAEFRMGSRTIEVEGSRSSKDKFFVQYVYGEKDPATGRSERTEKSLSERDNERDVKMAALTNLLGNGITRILGIRNLSYADLTEFAGITPEMIGKVEYKQKGENKPPIGKPQEKKPNTPTGTLTVIQIANAAPRVGKGPYKITDTTGVAYATFDDKVFEAANAAIVSSASVKVTYTTDSYGHKLTSFEVAEARTPGAEG